MSNNYFRVDDRLIHGQIITEWAINLGINKIITIDGKTVANPMNMSIPRIIRHMCVAWQR